MPAPLVTGRLCLELVATVRSRFGPAPHDGIPDGAGLRAWLTAVGMSPSEIFGEVEARQFRLLREALFRLVTTATAATAATAGTPTPTAAAPATPETVDAPTEADLALLNEHVAVTVPVPRARSAVVNGAVTFVADRAPLSAGQALAVLAGDGIDLLTGPEVRLLHQCEAGPCGAFFVDASRGGRRRWCLSTTCGNRVRVGAYRSRMAGTAGTTGATRPDPQPGPLWS